VEAVKSVKDSADSEAIKKVLQELSTELQKIGQAMYKDQGNPPTGGPSGESPSGEEPKN
jgi:hypothetical protein